MTTKTARRITGRRSMLSAAHLEAGGLMRLVARNGVHDAKPTVSHRVPNQFKVVSYFAGCGGMDLGFHGGFDYKGAEFKRHPFQLLRAYDFDERCVETYKLNLSEHIEHANLTEVSPVDVPAADVLIGGFPCQDFSSCGPKRGLTSARGKLYRALVDYMEFHRPLVVVGENVPNLARMNSGAVMKQIIGDLEAVGDELVLVVTLRQFQMADEQVRIDIDVPGRDPGDVARDEQDRQHLDPRHVRQRRVARPRLGRRRRIAAEQELQLVGAVADALGVPGPGHGLPVGRQRQRRASSA